MDSSDRKAPRDALQRVEQGRPGDALEGGVAVTPSPLRMQRTAWTRARERPLVTPWSAGARRHVVTPLEGASPGCGPSAGNHELTGPPAHQHLILRFRVYLLYRGCSPARYVWWCGRGRTNCRFPSAHAAGIPWITFRGKIKLVVLHWKPAA